MKRAQFIGISIAGVSALLAFVLVKGMLNKPTEEKRVEVKVN